jgi:hypothetical protein
MKRRIGRRARKKKTKEEGRERVHRIKKRERNRRDLGRENSGNEGEIKEKR